MKMSPLRRATCLALAGSGAALQSFAARAQQARPATPAPGAPLLDGPLKIVVGYAPGGASDRAARLLAESLKDRLGVPVLVENKTGAGGRLSAQQVKAVGPDQNVLLAGNPAIHVVAPLVASNVGYDPNRDFTPVSMMTRYDFAVAVGAAVPVREFTHLIAWLKANPEKANFGVPATGSLPHFFALMVGEKAQIKAQVVGYRGSGPLLTDLIGGQVPVAFDTLDTLLQQHEAGKLRILATSGPQRSSFSPQVPTFKEAGLNLVATGWNAFFAPASMPADRVARLGAAIREVMQDADTQRKFHDSKIVPVASTPAQTTAMLKAYRAQWAPVVRQSGYQP